MHGPIGAVYSLRSLPQCRQAEAARLTAAMLLAQPSPCILQARAHACLVPLRSTSVRPGSKMHACLTHKAVAGSQEPLLPGDSEWQQLLHIFKLLGTPSEETWPGVTKLKDWHAFPQWGPQDLRTTFPHLDAHGIDLMQRMFAYDPIKRLSVCGRLVSALLHEHACSGQTAAINPGSMPCTAPRASGPSCLHGIIMSDLAVCEH